MVRFLSLSSGSNGNCYYFGNDRTAFLIDLGIGTRTVKKRLAEQGLSIDDIDAVFVTHDHFDHIKSLGTFTERYHKPVYLTRTLEQALRRNFCTAGRLKGCVRFLEEGKEAAVGDSLLITPFVVPHDATQTVGYHFTFDGERFTVMTDLGEVTDDAVRYASLADHLVVESNYDVDMLVTGSYPRELKERILMQHGHLSNEQAASLLRRACHEGLRDVYLCHLSANNNTPRLAFESAQKTLGSVGSRASLHCLPRSSASELFTF
jgi:Metal-dependent hydrolases of the beta-lactamase superfamily I